MGVNYPRGMTYKDPRGMVGRISVEDQLILLHTKYRSSGPHGFRKEDFLMFLMFSHYSLWELITTEVANLDPGRGGGLIGKIYVGDN